MLNEEDSAYGVWCELERLYSARDDGRVILIEEQICKMKMVEGQTAESHIAAMNKLYGKLAGAGGQASDQIKA